MLCWYLLQLYTLSVKYRTFIKSNSGVGKERNTLLSQHTTYYATFRLSSNRGKENTLFGSWEIAYGSRWSSMWILASK